MSNRNPDESSGHRKPKVSLAMTISQGLGGPKAKPKGVADGQPVNIPAPVRIILRRDTVEILEKIIGFRGWSNPAASRIKLSRKAF
jgi:hypothetical protein